MDAQQTRNILEACLLVAGRAMSVAQLEALFESDIDRPDRKEIKLQLEELQKTYEGRGIELIEVASGWRLQSRSSMEHWVSRLFTEKSPRYSRALLETLVLIAYRQPITRGEIEEIRGVAVSSNIIRTLQEREWVKEVGHKEVPGRPALLGTTRQFLDYFNLKRLDELPPLSEIKDLEEIDATLAAEMGIGAAANEVADAINEAAEGQSDGVSADEANTDGAVAEPGEAADDDGSSSAEEDTSDITADGSTGSDAQADSDLVADQESSDEVVADADTETDDVTETDAADETDDAISDADHSQIESLSEDDDVDEADDDDIDASDALDSDGESAEPEAGSEPENDALGELDPQTELRRVISEFADEHQRELDVQKDVDSRNLTTVDDSPDDSVGHDGASDADIELSAIKKKALAVELVAEHDVMSFDENPDLEPTDDVVSDTSAGAVADTTSSEEPEP